jgi:hypothetical protein
MRYKCLSCKHIASTRSSSGCPNCGEYNIQEIPDSESSVNLDEAKDIFEKDPNSKKSYSSNKEYCIGLLAKAKAKVKTKAKKLAKNTVEAITGQKVEYVGNDGQDPNNDGQDSNYVGPEKEIVPQLPASSALGEAEKALEEGEKFRRDKKNAKIISKIQQLLEEEEDKNAELEDDQLIDDLRKIKSVLLEESGFSKRDAEGIGLESEEESAGFEFGGDIIEDGGGTGGKLKDLKKKADEAFDKLKNLTDSLKSGEELVEGANDLGDIGSTCSELANHLHELAEKLAEVGKQAAEHTGQAAEHAGHATGNAAAAAPIIGAAISIALMAKDIKRLGSVWKRMKKQHEIRDAIFDDGQGEEAPNAGLEAAYKCIKNIQVEERRFLAADIVWQAMTAAGHLASLSGVGAMVGLPLAISGAVASFATAQGKKALEYKHAHDHHKADKGRELDELNDDNAVKVIKHNPRKATQIIINQVKTGGYQGSLAVEYLKTFGVKEELIKDISSGDQGEKIAANEVTRVKVLRKLDCEDEDPTRIQEDLKEAGTAIKNYVPSSRKLKALRDLREAKNLLVMSGLDERGKGWLVRNVILSTDPEEEKAQLLAAVKQGIEKGELDGKDGDIIHAMACLEPTPEDQEFKRV